MTGTRSRTLPLLTAFGALALGLTACGSVPGPAPSSSEPAPSASSSSAPSPSTSSPTATSSSAAQSTTASVSPSATPLSAPAGTVVVYEDFSCPHCHDFAEAYGGFLTDLTEEDGVPVEYRVVDFLGRGDPQSWSTRAANAYYCFEEQSQNPARSHAYQAQLFSAAETGGVEDTELVSRAQELDVDIAQCVADRGQAQRTEQANVSLPADGAQGVPAIFFEGTMFDYQEHGEFPDWIQEVTGTEAN